MPPKIKIPKTRAGALLLERLEYVKKAKSLVSCIKSLYPSQIFVHVDLHLDLDLH